MFMSKAKEGDKRKVLVCSNYAWTLVNFRMPLIKSLLNAGYEVCVLTQYDGYEALIENEGVTISPLYISRKGINPFVDLGTLLSILRALSKLRPNYILLFTIKPVIYGAIAAKILRIPSIIMITGLGTAFISDNWITKVVKRLYRFALSSVSVIFFQNVDDRTVFVDQKLVNEKVCRYTPGSGVDINKFSYSVLPNTAEISFLLIARMLWDKGIGEFVEAARTLKLKYPNTRFQLLGPLGVQNRTSIKNTEMKAWENEGIIEYLGETDDVTSYIEKACCVVLPSYREGTSRVLLEAAAMGRPLIAADVPGCREVVEDGVTGLLCKPRNYVDLSQKIELMLKLPYETRHVMGKKGRDKIENEFRQEIVCDLYIDAIKRCGSGQLTH